MRCCRHPYASSSSAHLGHSGTADDAASSLSGCSCRGAPPTPTRTQSAVSGTGSGSTCVDQRRPGSKRQGGRHPFVPWWRTLGCLLAGGSEHCLEVAADLLGEGGAAQHVPLLVQELLNVLPHATAQARCNMEENTMLDAVIRRRQTAVLRCRSKAH